MDTLVKLISLHLSELQDEFAQQASSWQRSRWWTETIWAAYFKCQRCTLINLVTRRTTNNPHTLVLLCLTVSSVVSSSLWVCFWNSNKARQQAHKKGSVDIQQIYFGSSLSLFFFWPGSFLNSNPNEKCLCQMEKDIRKRGRRYLER